MRLLAGSQALFCGVSYDVFISETSDPDVDVVAFRFVDFVDLFWKIIGRPIFFC